MWYRCVKTNGITNSNTNNIAAMGVIILTSIEECKKLCHISLSRLAKSTWKSPEFAIHTGQRITN